MADTAEDLVRAGVRARREGRLEEARRYLTQAIEGLGETDPQLLAAAHRELGEIQRNTGDREGAVASYERAVSVLRNGSDPLRLAHTLRHLGDIHREQSQPGDAEPHYLETLSIYAEHADAPVLDVANATRSLAALREQTGNTEEAVALWQRARDLYGQANVAEGVEGSTARLARLARQSG